jgi:hypothetical protein
MPSINDNKHEEAVNASWEATRGAVSGAVKWGIASALLGGIGYALSPVYRGLTIQFKVYVPRLSIHLSIVHIHIYTTLSCFDQLLRVKRCRRGTDT